jgi:transposase-like protein
MTPFSQDLRQRIIDTVLRGEGTMAQIAARFLVSVSFVTRLLQLYRTTDSVEPRPTAEATRRYSHLRISSGSASSSQTGPMPRSRSVVGTSAPRAVSPPSPAP